jgi:polyisoprenyl-teichoic acid--peptidoglycan teichoic acid transferase
MRTEPINFMERGTQRGAPKRNGALFFILLFTVLLLVGGCIRWTLIPAAGPLDPDAYDPITLEPKKPEGFFKRIKHFVFSKEITLEGERKDRINILLLGQGGLGHDGPFLTDTIIMVSIKPSTGDIGFISIPRDLAVKIPGHGVQKINHANALGEAETSGSGPDVAQRVIEKTFDQGIHYYIRVDFEAFSELIDAVGGVTIDVERSFTDYEYPAGKNQYQVVSFAKGEETMNGDRALMFVRSRHGNNGEGSDFARSKRQQKVILALKEKMLSFKTLSNPARIKSIVDTLGDHVATNMEFPDIVTFVKMARELDVQKITTLPLDNSHDGFLVNGVSSIGAFILEPVAGDFDDINQAIENIFDAPADAVALEHDETPSQAPPPLPSRDTAPSVAPDDETTQEESETNSVFGAYLIEIQNGTWEVGLAARAKKTLADQGFVVTEIGNTQVRPRPRSGIYTLSDDVDVVVQESIEEILNIPIVNSLPQGETAVTSTDIMIILGQDFVE